MPSIKGRLCSKVPQWKLCSSVENSTDQLWLVLSLGDEDSSSSAALLGSNSPSEIKYETSTRQSHVG